MNSISVSKNLKVAVIGQGNVGSHLAEALKGKVDLFIVNPHTLEGLPDFVDVAVIAVKDTVTAEVAKAIDGRAGIIAHTSGSVPLSAISGVGTDTGVFYPLQTFTKGVALDYSDIPFFIEGSSPECVGTLKGLAGLISGNVREAGSEERRQLHIAAVFACNFSNYLVDIADKLLNEKGMDYKVLLPLLRQTVSKLHTVSPEEAQTGPAARNDLPVINRHLEMLSATPRLQDLYKTLSEMIMGSEL